MDKTTVSVTFDQRGDGGLHDVVVVADSSDVDRVRRQWDGTDRILVVIEVTDRPDVFGVRWFSPTGEIELCGSGACAAANFLFGRLENGSLNIRLQGLYHEVPAEKGEDALRVRLPVFKTTPMVQAAQILSAMSIEDCENAVVSRDLRTAVLHLASDFDLSTVTPDFHKLRSIEDPSIEAVIVTTSCRATGFDFRYFTPWHGLDESPIAVSANALLGPYWRSFLGASSLVGRQLAGLMPTFKLEVDPHGTWLSWGAPDAILET